MFISGIGREKGGRMTKHKRHNAEQIIGKLREAGVELAKRLSVGQICRKLEVSEHSYYRCRKE